MKLLSTGTWWLKSKIDPRWNCSDSTDVGGFSMPDECRAALEALKKKYGNPPEDLEWGYMKD